MIIPDAYSSVMTHAARSAVGEQGTSGVVVQFDSEMGSEGILKEFLVKIRSSSRFSRLTL